MKRQAVLIPFFLLIVASAALADDNCRSWRLPPSHVLYFRDINAIRIEFPQKARPHSSVRIHFGPCSSLKYIEAKASASFWSELANKAIGFDEICTPKAPCSSRHHAFLDSLYALQHQVYQSVWERDNAAFAFLSCSEKYDKALLLRCKLVRPQKPTLSLELIEKDRLSPYPAEKLSDHVVALGKKGILLRKDKDRLAFQDYQRGTLLEFSRNQIRTSLPPVLSRHSHAFVSLLQRMPLEFASLLVLSRETWWLRLQILSEPRLWIFSSPLEMIQQRKKP